MLTFFTYAVIRQHFYKTSKKKGINGLKKQILKIVHHTTLLIHFENIRKLFLTLQQLYIGLLIIGAMRSIHIWEKR